MPMRAMASPSRPRGNISSICPAFFTITETRHFAMISRSFIAVCVVTVAACVDTHLASKAGAYEVKSESMPGPHHTNPVVLVHPLLDRHPGYLAVFVTGDDGWSG